MVMGLAGVNRQAKRYQTGDSLVVSRHVFKDNQKMAGRDKVKKETDTNIRRAESQNGNQN